MTFDLTSRIFAAMLATFDLRFVFYAQNKYKKVHSGNGYFYICFGPQFRSVPVQGSCHRRSHDAMPRSSGRRSWHLAKPPAGIGRPAGRWQLANSDQLTADIYIFTLTAVV